MEELLNIPVTLVIKAPNQKIADQHVECNLEWTVRKLKEHLSAVYPNKPLENHQKIIYSGRLLQDDLILKEVLKQYEPNQSVHTVHLVCAPTTTNDFTPAAPSSPSISSQPEGLRHRIVASSQSSVTVNQPLHGATIPVDIPSFESPMYQYVVDPSVSSGGYPVMPGYSPVGLPTGPLPANYMMDPSAAQMMWMQQIYSQYYTHYLQYYQQQQPSVVTPPTQSAPQPPAQPAAPVAAAAARPRVEANAGMRMNAQGGAVIDDDEDEDGVNRDWLDWIYTFMRFSMLMCILYFYSSVSRFLATMLFVSFFYLYQRGWFRFNRAERQELGDNNNNRQQQPNVQQQQQARNDEVNPARPPAEEAQVNEAPQTPDQQSEATEAPSAEANVAVQRNNLGVLMYAWNFVAAFFGSLAPQQPPPVNAN